MFIRLILKSFDLGRYVSFLLCSDDLYKKEYTPNYKFIVGQINWCNCLTFSFDMLVKLSTSFFNVDTRFFDVSTVRVLFYEL